MAVRQDSDALPEGSWAASAGVRRAMLGNRSSDTSPELRLRSALHRRGLRYRKHVSLLLDDGVRTRPDVLFTAARVAVFLDGCFWHRCPQHATDPRTNSSYWARKLDANVARDRRADAALAAAGWSVVRVWEHEAPEGAAARVAAAVERGRRRSRSEGAL